MSIVVGPKQSTGVVRDRIRVMKDPKSKNNADPMPQEVARLYPTYIVLKTVMAAGLTALSIGVFYIFTRILTKYAIHSIALAGLLHISLDRVVVAVLDSETQKKKFRKKNPLKRILFFYALSIMIFRSIGPLFFASSSDANRFHFFALIWTLFRYTMLFCFGSLLFGVPYMSSGIGYGECDGALL